MATPQISNPGGRSSQSFVEKIGGLITRAAKGPGLLHSMLFGAVCGVGTYAGYYAYRGVKILLFDTQSIALQSRERYAEKQRLFEEEVTRQHKLQYIASFVAEYDPVATRMPFKPLDPKYRF